MIGTPAISNTIREGKIEQMVSLMETGKRYGMQMMDDHLLELAENLVINPIEARKLAVNKARFR
jgi:twitching motility protein PilT